MKCDLVKCKQFTGVYILKTVTKGLSWAMDMLARETLTSNQRRHESNAAGLSCLRAFRSLKVFSTPKTSRPANKTDQLAKDSITLPTQERRYK